MNADSLFQLYQAAPVRAVQLTDENMPALGELPGIRYDAESEETEAFFAVRIEENWSQGAVAGSWLIATQRPGFWTLATNDDPAFPPFADAYIPVATPIEPAEPQTPSMEVKAQQSDYRPPMWGIYLEDPTGKYGPHKEFYEHGETLTDAEASTLARYRSPGTTIDSSRPGFLAQAARGAKPADEDPAPRMYLS